MTPNQQAGALAEMLGWTKGRLYWDDAMKQANHVESDWAWWQGEHDLKVFVEQWRPMNDWRSMGLVVEAMAEKDWHREVKHYRSGLVSVVFDGKGGTFMSENWDHNEPVAVAEAAYKALGGE